MVRRARPAQREDFRGAPGRQLPGHGAPLGRLRRRVRPEDGLPGQRDHQPLRHQAGDLDPGTERVRGVRSAARNCRLLKPRSVGTSIKIRACGFKVQIVPIYAYAGENMLGLGRNGYFDFDTFFFTCKLPNNFPALAP